MVPVSPVGNLQFAPVTENQITANAKKGKRLSLAPSLKMDQLEAMRQDAEAAGGDGIIAIENVTLRKLVVTRHEFATESRGRKKRGLLAIFERDGDEIALPMVTSLCTALGIDLAHSGDEAPECEYIGSKLSLFYRGKAATDKGNDAWIFDVILLD